MPFRITQTRLFLQDEYVNLDDITELEDDTIFSFDQQPVRPYEKDLDLIMEIKIERNLD